MVFNLFGNATESIAWVPNPTTRGTSNILQSCLITTSLCVWTALHLNLKEQNDPTFLRISYQTWRKTGWLIIGLLAPEMVVYTAWYQRSQAKRFRDEYNERFGLTPPPGKLKRVYRWLFHREAKEVASAGEEGSVEMRIAPRQEQITTIVRREKLPWTLTQGFYAQMGGFALETIGAYPEFLPEVRTTLDQFSFEILLEDGEPLIPFPSENTPEGSNKNLSPSQNQHLNQENENGELEITGFDIASAESPQNEKHTEDESKVDAVENTVNKPSSKIPNYNLYEPLNISKKDLQDKSKANGLAKSLVCFQAFWFCVQCLARVAQALPVTLLELNTFAHSTCALLIYILWWDKPLDVEQPTYLPIRGIEAISKWSEIDRFNSHSHGIRKFPRVVISELKRRVRMQSADHGTGHVMRLKTLNLTNKIPEGVPR
jgi:hypothetical protein